MRSYRAPVLIVIVGLSLFFYLYFNPSYLGVAIIKFPFPGDIPAYLTRFLLSFVFMGLIPLAALLFLGFSLEDAGLVWHKGMFRSKIYLVILPVIILVMILSSSDKAIREFYPYSKTMLQLAAGNPLPFFALHASLYLFLYYLPWEILFRGIMVLPLVHHYEQISGAVSATPGKRRGQFFYPAVSTEQFNSWKNPALLSLAILQIIPTTLIHLAHPFAESISTTVFGVLGGIIILRTRSVFPMILFHALSGIMLDLAILIRTVAGI